ncbi:winged helix-turn-helix transcriptional regulator [Gulosibacter molinativorax]|uniref:Transcriptional regulator n=1 Tax=Gulosibacter molinativorax TaxID=256821 RepID=A0ABT7CA75_9MICO|nr:helix-turn-helix domain-containing protein [Gulosibacter molinativorax]MDJ1372098.1 transcriptional regulator [Gulosibacter molinativorax]QUY62358.1 HxlR family transcriptional regulator [Gulosibacter molinativorax]
MNTHENTTDLPKADVFSSACDSRAALQHLTGRWGALTVAALQLDDAPMRFGEIRRRIDGISDRMLSQTLGQLERDGMVVRTVHSSIPPNVDYALTDLGKKIAAPMLALIGMLEDELPQVVEAQRAYDDAHPAE